MADFTVKNKDGTVDKKETSRLKSNAALLKEMVRTKTDMFGKVRGPRISEIPLEAFIAGARQLLAIGGAKRSQTELQMKRIVKKIQKKYLGKPPPFEVYAHGGKVHTKAYAKGGGVRKPRTYG